MVDAGLTTKMLDEFKDVKSRFVYTRDPSLDRWKIHKTDGQIKGDCEDFALTLLWQLSGRSMWKLWLNVIFMRAMIWHVTAYNGEGHAVLWYRGFWADNMERRWYQTEEMRHTRRFPFIAPLMAVKLLIGFIARGF